MDSTMENKDHLIEHNGSRYKLTYTEEIIEFIEKILGHSVMGSIYQNNAMMPYGDLKYMFIYGLMDYEGKRVSETKALNVWQDIKKEIGYKDLVGLVLEAFQRDCPFFFQMN